MSGIRQKLELVESKMCANEWNSVNYEHVPSKANLNYKDAFLKHDETRRREFLEKVLKGEAKINSGVNFPHDVVHKYGRCPMSKDDAIEALWANLKNTLNYASSNIMVVRDGSGSMTSTISGTSISALEVATALAVIMPWKVRRSSPKANKSQIMLKSFTILQKFIKLYTLDLNSNKH